MTRWLAPLAALAVAACAPAFDWPAPAPETAASETIWFTTDEGEMLSGDLALPPGSGPFPAVVLMHGCGGFPSRTVAAWAPALRSWGYATFALDSFGGRQRREVCTDALALTPNRRIPDPYGAFRTLAAHPKVDPARIALMGFSHGATAVLGAATEWATRTYGTAPGFRVFLAFYPYCNAVVPEMSWVTAPPLRIHIGELDDWTPARTCEALVREARGAGADVEITVYRNARHSFDSVGQPVRFLPDVDNAADCTPRLAGMKGPILNLSELRQCLRKGATVGWDPAVTEEARKNVRAQLAEFLK